MSIDRRGGFATSLSKAKALAMGIPGWAPFSFFMREEAE